MIRTLMPVVLMLLAPILLALTDTAHALTLAPPRAIEPARAELTWTAPTLREDGTALTAAELSGYEIGWACGSAATQYVTIADPAQTQWLSPAISGHCEFAIRAVDSGGLQSQFSPTVVADIKQPSRPQPPKLSLLERLVAWVRAFFEGLS